MIKFLLKKCTKMYKTYNKVSDVFVEPTLHFHFGSWRSWLGLPCWRHGPVLYIGKHGQFIQEDDKYWYGAWAKHQVWDPQFLKTKGWWGRTWRKFIKPIYQLPIWMEFSIWNQDASVKSKWDYFSYEFPPQFCIVFFGLYIAWTLTAPSATTDFVGNNGRSYPCPDSYWESIYDYLYSADENTPLYNAISTVFTQIKYTPSEKKKNSELLDYTKTLKDRDSKEYKDAWKKIKKLGHPIAYCRCRPEYIKLSHIDNYFKLVEEVKKSKKEYNNYIWI